MAQERFREPDRDPDWLGEVHVVCPRCSGRAVVEQVGEGSLLRCDHCFRREQRPGSSARPCDGVEPVFGATLWATRPVGRHLLWVTNLEHLEYLQGYVAAGLRDRAGPPAPLSWYLPAWVKAAGRRDQVLRGLALLRVRLEED